MRRKKGLAVLIGCIIIALRIVTLTEGGLRVSTLGYEELAQYELAEMPGRSPSLVAASPEKDAVISVYRDEGGGAYILEFTRSLILDRYSLVETHHYTQAGHPFNSVISTSAYHYAYSVDPSQPAVEIYEGTASASVLDWLVLIVFSVLLLVFALERDKSKK